ncbi:RICIN domain-containing protein [Nonomuraea sp. NPDC049158]|uniref:RICIN domain-containing protein n=1 Tax=Nonomuraea sp. NPDC049158 TaxID=3155649 RepID=UPI0033FD9526
MFVRKHAGAALLAATAIVCGAVPQAARAAAVPVAGGVYQLKVTKSGQCLDVAGGSQDNGGLLQQWGCSGAAWQQFTVVSAGSGVYTLRGVNSGRCVDVPGGAATSGITGYGNYSRGATKMVIENSYYDNVKDPYYPDATAQLRQSGSVCVSCTGKSATSGSAFTPGSFYSYTLDPAADVPSLLRTYAGPQANIGT